MNRVVRLVIISMLAASLLAAQVLISFLPNIELVTLLLILYSCFLPRKDVFIVVIVFSILEALVWGFGDWVIGYLWIWNVLVILSQLFKPILKENKDYWAVFASFWGLLFGLLFAVQHAVLYSFSAGVAYYLKGLVFDVLHATGNYILVLILYEPLLIRFKKLYQRLEITYGNNNQKGR